MSAQYKTINFRFDHQRLAAELRKVNPDDILVFSQIIGVDESTFRNWRRDTYTNAQFAHPSMSNFISMVNHLDLNPADFFVLDIPEVET